MTGSTDDSVVLFRRATDSAELEYVELLQSDQGNAEGLAGASAIAASPDGKNVYVTAASDDALAVIATTSNLFADGFESGDIYRWPATFPLIDSPEDVPIG